MKKIILFLSCCILFCITLWSAPVRNLPIEIKQPSGESILCYITGDEFYHRMHDVNNYTIVYDSSTNYYCYAKEKDGELIPTGLIVGKDSPMDNDLKPNVNCSMHWIEEIKNQKTNSLTLNEKKESLKSTKMSQTTYNNVVFFVRFAGESEFSSDFDSFDFIYNDGGTNSNSCKNYFKTVSRGQFTVNSYFFPISSNSTINSYQDIYTRNYYQPYSAINPSGYTSTAVAQQRESDLVWRLVSNYSSDISNVISKIDNICLIFKGQWGMLGGNILWPHFTNYKGTNSNIVNGFKLLKINGYCELDILGSGLGNRAIAHELSHSLGAWDLYPAYFYTTEVPVGPWDVMSQDSGNKPHLMTSLSINSIGKDYECFTENFFNYSSLFTTHSIVPITTYPSSGCYNSVWFPLCQGDYFRTSVELRCPNFFDDWLSQPSFIVLGVDGSDNNFEIKVELLYDKTQYSINNAFYSQLVNRTRCDKNITSQVTSSGVVKNIMVSDSQASFELTRCIGDDLIINNPGYCGDDLWAGNRIETIGNTNCVSNNEFYAKNEILLGGGFQVELGNTFLAKTGFTGCE